MNRIYLHNTYTLKKQFESSAVIDFSGGIDTVDFSNGAKAAEHINSWVREKTMNKFDAIYQAQSFNLTTRAILLNAIYFKSSWLLPFNKAGTNLGRFYISQMHSVVHPMISQTGLFAYAVNTTLDSQILTMEYENEHVSMTIILPNSKTGIQALEKKMAYIDLHILAGEATKQIVTVTLPKFKIESTLELKDPLTQVSLKPVVIVTFLSLTLVFRS